jgi:hypothetical protein
MPPGDREKPEGRPPSTPTAPPPLPEPTPFNPFEKLVPFRRLIDDDPKDSAGKL